MKIYFKRLFFIGLCLSSIGLMRVIYFHVKANVAQYLLESAWDESKNTGILIKPWNWADTWPLLKITIPSIGQINFVLKDASGESLAFGPGLLTPNITPGEKGNSFIAGHRDTHFKNIGLLQIGESIIIENLKGNELIFKIDAILIVDSRLEQPITESAVNRLTLVTCYPFHAQESNTPYRFLVSSLLDT